MKIKFGMDLKPAKKKYFKSSQWLRNTKHKKYPFWRLDIIFSEKKHSDIFYIENGGWHFTNIKSPEDLEKKFLNFLHHQEFEESGLNLDDIKTLIKDNKILYDLAIDQKKFKWSGVKSLVKVSDKEMPEYLVKNLIKYKKWFEV